MITKRGRGGTYTRHRDSKTKKPRHRDSKTKKPRPQDSKIKKPRHRDSKTKKPRHRDSGIKTPRHREMETNKAHIVIPRRFFQRTKSRDIEIPRPKSHNIEFL